MDSPGTPFTAPKEALREELRRRLRGLTPESRAESSIAIQKGCIALPEWSRCQCVALYHPRPDEPEKKNNGKGKKKRERKKRKKR